MCAERPHAQHPPRVLHHLSARARRLLFVQRAGWRRPSGSRPRPRAGFGHRSACREWERARRLRPVGQRPRPAAGDHGQRRWNRSDASSPERPASALTVQEADLCDRIHRARAILKRSARWEFSGLPLPNRRPHRPEHGWPHASIRVGFFCRGLAPRPCGPTPLSLSWLDFAGGRRNRGGIAVRFYSATALRRPIRRFAPGMIQARALSWLDFSSARSAGCQLARCAKSPGPLFTSPGAQAM